MKLFLIAALTATLILAQPGAGKGKGRGGPAPLPVETMHCDRACLLDIANQYLAALVAHDPSKAPMAADAKFVEQAKAIKVGEGLWQTATGGPTAFKIFVPDPVSEQVGFLGMMQESGKPMELGLRLKVFNKQITEAEHLKATITQPSQLANLQTLRPGLTTPPKEKETRDYLLWAGASYYNALVNSDGSLAPFANDCVRRENGMQTTGNPASPQNPIAPYGCAKQLDTRAMSYIKVIDNRRVEIADPETGLVMGFSQFRHPMKEKVLKIVGVPGYTERPVNFAPFDLPAAHIFKVDGGKIHEIEAMGFSLPYNSPTGWER